MYLGTTPRFFSILYLGLVVKNSRILLDISRTSLNFIKHALNKNLAQVLDISRSILQCIYGFRDIKQTQNLGLSTVGVGQSFFLEKSESFFFY